MSRIFVLGKVASQLPPGLVPRSHEIGVDGAALVFAVAVSVGTGLVFGVRKPPPRNTKRERQQLLAALEGLEMGHRDGNIGPKTYERARRELIDELARTFAADAPRENATRKKGRA